MVTIEPNTATVMIFQGDSLDRIRHLEQQYRAAVESEKNGPPRMNDERLLSADLAVEHAELVAEAEASAINVVVKALGRKVWRALVAQHPPRKVGDDGVDEEDALSDAAVGVNEDTFRDPLISASIVSPSFTEDELDMLSEADNDRIYLAAYGLNRRRAVGPKALRASQPTTESAATSN